MPTWVAAQHGQNGPLLAVAQQWPPTYPLLHWSTRLHKAALQACKEPSPLGCLREATPPPRWLVAADLILSEHAGRSSHERSCHGAPLLRVQLQVVSAGCSLVQRLKQHMATSGTSQKQVASAAGLRANLCMWLGNAAQKTLSPASTAETDALVAAYLDDKVASGAATSTTAASAEAPVPPAATSAASATTPHVPGEGGACRVRLDLAVRPLRPHRRAGDGAAPRRKPPDHTRLLTEAAEFMGQVVAAGGPDSSERKLGRMAEVVEEAEGLQLHHSAENATGYRGCYLVASREGQPTRFTAQARLKGRQKHLGCFATAVEAAVCYARHMQVEEAESTPRPKRRRDSHSDRHPNRHLVATLRPHGASGAGAAAGAQPGGAGAKQPVAATVQKCAFSASGTLGRGLSAAAASVSGDPTIQRIAEFVMRHGGPVTALAGWTVLTKTRNGSGREKGHLRRVWLSPDGERLYSMRKVWPHPYAFRMR